MTTLQALITPYPATVPLELEELRRAVLTAVLVDGSDDDRARRAVTLAGRGAMRALLLGATVDDASALKIPTTTIDARLQALLPPLEGIRLALPAAGVTRSLLEVLNPYFNSSLPWKRVEGYCALAVICARNYASTSSN